MKFKIQDVERKGNLVEKVVVVVEGFIEISFRLINKKIKVVSRVRYGSTRMYDNSPLFIPENTWGKIAKQVYGIFYSSQAEKKQDIQTKLPL